MWQPFGNVGAVGFCTCVVSSPGVMPGGSLAGSLAASATANRSTMRSVPTMRNAPSPNSMSAADASSRFAAICLPLSMIFSEASCSAEPPTGSAREPPVRPRGERSLSP